MATVTLLLGLLYFIGAFVTLFIFFLFVRDFIDSVFYEDKGVIRTIREIVTSGFSQKPGSSKRMSSNVVLGQCSQKHDRIKSGLYVLVDRKTGEVEIKECSRPDDGLIASGTRDA